MSTKKELLKLLGNNQITRFLQIKQLILLVKVNLKWALATNNYDPDNESFEIGIQKFQPNLLVKIMPRST